MCTKWHPPRLALALAALALAFPAAAAAASASELTKIYEACSNEKVPAGYSQQAYSQAIKEMEPFLAEYTPCPYLIHKAQLAGAAGSHGAGTSGGPGEAGAAVVAAATPTEQHTLEGIPHASAPPVQVGGEVIHPGVVHVNLASAFNTLPTPLLALLAFLLACALLVIAWAVHRRVRRAGAPAGGDSIAGE
ncbi:MAG TPA: hypothetical protein VG147_02240 [Solirubrobacteraceae bacterium]|nr:hypothetical protein [Solirubrobacteraceae bacterium]